MPRNASGTYTLPSGNPVVAGTTIEASWANTTLDDVANELTNSLSRTGAGGMLAPFRLADGTVSAPGIAFLNETSSGLYRPSASNVGIAVSGVNAMTWSNANVVVPSGIQFTTSNCVISGLPTPTSASSAATKSYVDAALAAVTTSSTRQTYTATASQTTFSINYNVGSIDVYRNGAKQVNGTDFTATNGTSVVFTSGLPAGDIVDMVAYGAVGSSGTSLQVISTNTAAASNCLYVMTASLTLTLPAAPAVGDTVKVSNLSGTTTCVVGRNGNNIQALAEDLTIDSLNAAVTLTYANATLGWVFA
jgi:hypothetical protein